MAQMFNDLGQPVGKQCLVDVDDRYQVVVSAGEVLPLPLEAPAVAGSCGVDGGGVVDGEPDLVGSYVVGAAALDDGREAGAPHDERAAAQD